MRDDRTIDDEKTVILRRGRSGSAEEETTTVVPRVPGADVTHRILPDPAPPAIPPEIPTGPDTDAAAPDTGTAAPSNDAAPVIDAAAPVTDAAVAGHPATERSYVSFTDRPRRPRRAIVGEGIDDDLEDVPTVAAEDPAGALMVDPQVRENRRFCKSCLRPVGRGPGGRPGPDRRVLAVQHPIFLRSATGCR